MKKALVVLVSVILVMTILMTTSVYKTKKIIDRTYERMDYQKFLAEGARYRIAREEPLYKEYPYLVAFRFYEEALLKSAMEYYNREAQEYNRLIEENSILAFLFGYKQVKLYDLDNDMVEPFVPEDDPVMV